MVFRFKCKFRFYPCRCCQLQSFYLLLVKATSTAYILAQETHSYLFKLPFLFTYCQALLSHTLPRTVSLSEVIQAVTEKEQRTDNDFGKYPGTQQKKLLLLYQKLRVLLHGGI